MRFMDTLLTRQVLPPFTNTSTMEWSINMSRLCGADERGAI